MLLISPPVSERVVPEVGVEPTWSQAPGDFESPASTSFTTPASRGMFRG